MPRLVHADALCALLGRNVGIESGGCAVVEKRNHKRVEYDFVAQSVWRACSVVAHVGRNALLCHNAPFVRVGCAEKQAHDGE